MDSRQEGVYVYRLTILFIIYILLRIVQSVGS